MNSKEKKFWRNFKDIPYVDRYDKKTLILN